MRDPTEPCEHKEVRVGQFVGYRGTYVRICDDCEADIATPDEKAEIERFARELRERRVDR